MIAFIIGCARSGTSILGELMGSHEHICYIGERAQHIWHDGVVTGHHYMNAEDITLERREKISDYFRHGGRRIVEKCPPNILRVLFIHGIFPKAKFIHIVRDGRDVACSLVPGLADSWQHLKPPGWQNAEAAYLNEPLKQGAWLWKNALYFGLRDLREIDHIQIKYEDLVYDPLGIAKQVFTYLRMTVDPNVMAFCSKIQDQTMGSYHANGQSHWYRSDHKYRVGRWKENIPKNKLAKIELICQPVLEQLEYKKRG